MNRSFEILAAEYRPMVVAYLRSLVGDAHLAEDLAQETFLAAYQALSQFESGGNFGAWVRGIARNKAKMHWRSASRRPLLIDSRVVEGINEVFDSLDRKEEEGDWWEERRTVLRGCVSRLSDHLRAAVDQVYSQDQNLDEAASVLGSTRAAIGQRLSRARNLLRECVARKLQSAPSDLS